MWLWGKDYTPFPSKQIVVSFPRQILSWIWREQGKAVPSSVLPVWGQEAAAHLWPSRVCWAHTSPLWGLPFCHAPVQFRSRAFDLVWGDGRGREVPSFFFFPQLGTSNVSFSSVILSLQSGAIMIFYYVNIKDNCKALIKANFVSSLLPSLPLPDLVRDTINLISCPKLCMH